MLGNEAYLSQLKDDSKNKNLHNRSQSVFTYGQNGYNPNVTGSPFSSSLIKDNLGLNQSQLKNNGLNASLFNNQTNDYSNLGNVETGLARERPLGAGHRYNSHSMNFLPMLNSSMVNSNSMNSGASWGSPSLSHPNLAAKGGNANLNRMDLNNNKNIAANLLNTVAADRLLNSQSTSAALSGINSNYLDNGSDDVNTLAAVLGMNKKLNGYGQENLLNSDLLKGYNFSGKDLTSSLIDGPHSYSEERSSSVLSNGSNSSNINAVPSPFLNSNPVIENELLKAKFGLMDDNRTSNLVAANLLGNGQVKSPFQSSQLLSHKPKSSSVTLNYLEMSPKPQAFSPSHRRGVSLNAVAKKTDKGIVLDKTEKEDDDDSKISLTLNSSFSNEVLLSPEIENLPEIQQLENDEETLVESPTTLYVEYLDHSLSTNDLKPYFSKFGEIESMKIDSNKDVAFIKYKNSKDASKAKNEMNGKMIKTSEIQITFHTTEASENPIIVNTPTKSLWIGNIPTSLSPAELEKKFAKFGTIESTKLLSHKTSGLISFENFQIIYRNILTIWF